MKWYEKPTLRIKLLTSPLNLIGIAFSQIAFYSVLGQGPVRKVERGPLFFASNPNFF